MAIILGKKSLFFTFIALVMVSLFIFIFARGINVSNASNAEAFEKHSEILGNHVKGLEDAYLPMALYSSSHKAFMSLFYYINSTGSFLSDVQSNFSEVVLYGTIDRNPIDLITGRQLMFNSTFTNLSDQIADISYDLYGVSFSYSVNSVSLSQEDPWHVIVTANLSYDLNSTEVSWSRDNVLIESQLDIQDFYDPYFYINSQRTDQRPFTKSPVRYDRWTLASFNESIANRTYTHFPDSDAPSFLMRYENNTDFLPSSECCGIETVLNSSYYGSSALLEEYVDYSFWSHKYQDNCSALYNITSVKADFPNMKLNLNHTLWYGLANGSSRAC